ncbi:PLP-dependent aminotransferase family protein [Sporomusa sp.]|uniref:MocR-like pyridoxine biosynthesis transcription factor PdxR n=1 Tax=Sporomusa sp. TaxID=2078658 RepID=UPI002C8DD3AD|nr:PLP-dependent aminotransferase family protein [Sporomusa sp.]HWR44257.1 PLP-dependent aminotransferase family protein [Sporomusa sp.]
MFILDSKDRRPLHVKLYDQIKNQILSGKLIPYTKLPSVRHLSAELSISRNTVEYAYEQLCTEGFIHSKPQSGYYISLLDQEFIPRPCRTTATLIEPAFEDEKTYSYDFHPACLSPDSFPSKVWRKLLTDCLQEDPEQFASYCNPQGELELRREIQRYLERFRGVSCDAEQIIVCCGLQDSLSIIAQIMRGNHSALAVEDPGHWIPRSVFQNYSFSLSLIPVNSNGINLDYLKNTDSTVIYVTPSHQFPLGYVMPVENRLKLINWTETVGGVIIEDDYDSELRYHGKPIPALQGLHPKGNIIYVGTFSKVLSPALRVSYMVLPYQFLSAYNKIFRNYAATVSLLEQRTLYEFMKQGHWERHLRKMRTIYKRKHDALIQAIDRHFSCRVNILGQGAGLHVVLELVDNSLDEKELISRALENNVRVFPLSDTYQYNNNYPSQVILGFGRMNPDELEKGIKLLSQAWNYNKR